MNLQQLCEDGQQQLEQMDYLRAEAILQQAEQLAIEQHDFDTLSRLYMPLQETRRQSRQRCGEGRVRLDLISRSPTDVFDPAKLLAEYPHGQLLIAGWGSIEPAMQFRELARREARYVETFLAAAYPASGGVAVVIVPLGDIKLPEAKLRSIDELLRLVPVHSIVLNQSELPAGSRTGDTKTFAEVMSMWERLHAPFLAAADAQVDPLRKIDGYRRTIQVDRACELAHQKLSDIARKIPPGHK